MKRTASSRQDIAITTQGTKKGYCLICNKQYDLFYMDVKAHTKSKTHQHNRKHPYDQFWQIEPCEDQLTRPKVGTSYELDNPEVSSHQLPELSEDGFDESGGVGFASTDSMDTEEEQEEQEEQEQEEEEREEQEQEEQEQEEEDQEEQEEHEREEEDEQESEEFDTIHPDRDAGNEIIPQIGQDGFITVQYTASRQMKQFTEEERKKIVPFIFLCHLKGFSKQTIDQLMYLNPLLGCYNNVYWFNQLERHFFEQTLLFRTLEVEDNVTIRYRDMQDAVASLVTRCYGLGDYQHSYIDSTVIHGPQNSLLWKIEHDKLIEFNQNKPLDEQREFLGIIIFSDDSNFSSKSFTNISVTLANCWSPKRPLFFETIAVVDCKIYKENFKESEIIYKAVIPFLQELEKGEFSVRVNNQLKYFKGTLYCHCGDLVGQAKIAGTKGPSGSYPFIQCLRSTESISDTEYDSAIVSSVPLQAVGAIPLIFTSTVGESAKFLGVSNSGKDLPELTDVDGAISDAITHVCNEYGWQREENGIDFKYQQRTYLCVLVAKYISENYRNDNKLNEVFQKLGLKPTMIGPYSCLESVVETIFQRFSICTLHLIDINLTKYVLEYITANYAKSHNIEWARDVNKRVEMILKSSGNKLLYGMKSLYQEKTQNEIIPLVTGLNGNHCRTILRIAPILFHGMLGEKEMQILDYFLVIFRLSKQYEFTEQDIVHLGNSIVKFRSEIVSYTQQMGLSINNKPVFGTILYLPMQIRFLGPLQLFSTQKYENINTFIKPMCSITGNRGDFFFNATLKLLRTVYIRNTEEFRQFVDDLQSRSTTSITDGDLLRKKARLSTEELTEIRQDLKQLRGTLWSGIHYRKTIYKQGDFVIYSDAEGDNHLGKIIGVNVDQKLIVQEFRKEKQQIYTINYGVTVYKHRYTLVSYQNIVCLATVKDTQIENHHTMVVSQLCHDHFQTFDIPEHPSKSALAWNLSNSQFDSPYISRILRSRSATMQTIPMGNLSDEEEDDDEDDDEYDEWDTQPLKKRRKK